MARGKHPNSIANLKPIQPGEVRNPEGINRKRPYSDRYLELAEQEIPKKIREKLNKRAGQQVLQPGATWADAENLNLHLRATEEVNPKAVKELADRLEGKAPIRVEIQGATRTETTLEVIFRQRLSQSSSE